MVLPCGSSLTGLKGKPDSEKGEEVEPLRFGTSGIRGVVGEYLEEDGCRCAGRALGTLLGQGAHVCIAHDTRRSGPAVAGWVIDGLVASGADVVDFGIAPTPALAALTRAGGYSAGVMITASHNPPQYNGIKLFDGEGVGFSRDLETRIEQLLEGREFASGAGSVRRDGSALERYIETIPPALVRDAVSGGMALLLDPGNGAASGFARAVFERLGFQVAVVNDTPDGLFPGRGSEPSAMALHGTHAALRASSAQLAACFDGDADRVVFCDRDGFVGLDETVAFVAQHAVRQSSRRVFATTVETGLLPQYAVEEVGGHAIRGRVGDVAVAHLVREHDAALGAETVGVYIFPEQGLYPDSMVAVLRVLATLPDPSGIRRFVKALPRVHLVKRKVQCPSPLKTRVMSRVDEMLMDALDVPADVTVNRTDGVRLEMQDAWVLVRPSGTEPVVRVTTESTEPARADYLALGADAIVTRLVAETARAGGTGGVA